MGIKKHIPNLLTCGNLFCGCLAIVSAFKGDLVWSAYFVGIAAVLDFFDGFCARLLKVGGELGKQLDSLADMVTFGVVPGVIMYHLIGQTIFVNIMNTDYITTISTTHLSGYLLLPYAGFLITIFSCIRLAKFNIDTRQTTSFIGVPTPANTIFIASLPLILRFQSEPGDKLTNFILNPYLLLGITVVMSYMLIAELPLFALKFKSFGWAGNKIRYSFLIISVILLILFQFIAIPFIIFLYIILSVINNMTSKEKA